MYGGSVHWASCKATEVVLPASPKRQEEQGCESWEGSRRCRTAPRSVSIKVFGLELDAHRGLGQ